MTKYEDFIDDDYIEGLIKGSRADEFEIRDILAKARENKGLSPEEAAKLSNIGQSDLLEELFQTARQIKRDIYGNRIVFFAPLYINNYCTNDCLYCAFRSSNDLVRRHSLTEEELRQEVLLLEGQGHKRLILVFGESPSSSAQLIAATV
ncbi:MAG: [FeFe] hydrogenase H-cluster radical SAM maturase HydG, partial [Smithellaceae bacterium]|nr:[FeFe] hydrogenase H-cluster radical SAM maturase HydG [Smithellaceae bacterium]